MIINLAAFSAATLRAMWDDYAAHLIKHGGTDEDLQTLNRIALAYGDKLGVCVFLSGTDWVRSAA